MMKNQNQKKNEPADGFSIRALAGYLTAVVLLLSVLLDWQVSMLGFVLVSIVYYVFFYAILLLYQKFVTRLLLFVWRFVSEKIKHIKKTKEAASK